MINDNTKRKLNELNLHEFVSALDLINSDINTINLSFDEKMTMIVDIVYQEKYNESVKNLKKRAKLRFKEADLKDIHYTANRNISPEIINSLATCNYINLKTNVIIHGPCGTGKTWLACALANEAVKQKFRVYYIRLPEMLEKHAEQRNMGKTLSQVVKSYNKYDLLIIDEWLMYKLEEKDRQFIAELMEVRYDKSSTIFCSQYNSDDWYNKLGASTLTEALLDRIVHNKIDIYMGTKNFREK